MKGSKREKKGDSLRRNKTQAYVSDCFAAAKKTNFTANWFDFE